MQASWYCLLRQELLPLAYTLALRHMLHEDGHPVYRWLSMWQRDMAPQIDPHPQIYFHTSGYAAGERPIPDVPVAADVVKDYGAVGDGVADDSDAFVRAIAETESGAIFVPPGMVCTYFHVPFVCGCTFHGPKAQDEGHVSAARCDSSVLCVGGGRRDLSGLQVRAGSFRA